MKTQPSSSWLRKIALIVVTSLVVSVYFATAIAFFDGKIQDRYELLFAEACIGTVVEESATSLHAEVEEVADAAEVPPEDAEVTDSGLAFKVLQALRASLL